jgi:gas vesicle protein
MKNPFKTSETNILVPVVIGAAAAGAIAYLLLSDNASDLRSKITDNLDKGWRTVKDKVPAGKKAITDLKNKALEKAASLTQSAKDVGDQPYISPS